MVVRRIALAAVRNSAQRVIRTCSNFVSACNLAGPQGITFKEQGI